MINSKSLKNGSDIFPSTGKETNKKLTLMYETN